MKRSIKLFLFSIVAIFLVFSEFPHEQKTIEHSSQQVEINIEFEIDDNEVENDEMIKLSLSNHSDKRLTEYDTELHLLKAQYSPQIIIPPPDYTYL